MRVLYEDNHTIAVFKPAGLLTQPDKPHQKSLLDEVKQYLKNKYHKPGQVFLGLVHRLDRNTAGIVVLGKTSKGAARLSEQFRQKKIVKIYTALVHGEIKTSTGNLKNFLLKNQTSKKSAITSDLTGQQAELYYQVIKKNKLYSLLKINLGTGRFHQIRAQMAGIGHPIIGDIKYGAPQPLPDRSLGLVATELHFYQVINNQKIILKVPYPASWKKYLTSKEKV